MARKSPRGRPRKSARAAAAANFAADLGRETLVALLELKDVSAFYGRIQALRNVTLEVDQGEVVALIGSNGAGKTTTLRTISGLMHPAAGSVSFDTRDI